MGLGIVGGEMPSGLFCMFSFELQIGGRWRFLESEQWQTSQGNDQSRNNKMLVRVKAQVSSGGTKVENFHFIAHSIEVCSLCTCGFEFCKLITVFC